MAKKSKEQMKAMGNEMVRLAKSYRKSHPSSAWKSCMKAAGAEYRKKHHKKK